MARSIRRQDDMSQEARNFALEGLGEDWSLVRVRGEEGLSRMFEYRCEVVCESIGGDLVSMLGTTAKLRVHMPEFGDTRYIHGIVTECEYLNVEGELHHAVITLRPWLWILKFETDCRIFQEMSVVDIVKQVCADCSYTDIEVKLAGTYAKREYCVQYRESACDFVSRLLEEEGIHYHFEHTSSSHTLVLSDENPSHESLGTIEYFPPDEQSNVRRGTVYAWRYARSFRSGKYTLRDYDFKKPTVELVAEASDKLGLDLKGRQRFDYPGAFTEGREGTAYAKVRLQESQGGHRLATAVTNDMRPTAGKLFTLDGHPLEQENREYLVLSALVEMANPEYLSGAGADDVEYRCTMTLLDSKLPPFRPQRVTPRPVVHGVQTAVVVGKSGDEIHTDEHGRVKLHFHWDRYDKKDEKSSCWVRVAQLWAGKRWGGIWLPRIGDEVIVEFMEGDPDQPIVIGSVYNGANRPPYALPTHATQSGVLTNSSKNGNPKTANELRFEDKKGSEQVYFHAENNFDRVVENNDTLKVGFEKKDKGDQTIDIYNDRTVTLKEGNDTLNVEKGDQTINVKTGDRTINVDKGHHTLNIKMGNHTVKISAGKSTTEAMQSIELKVGASTIKLTPGSIEIKSAMIKIEASMMAEVKAGATAEVKAGAMTTIKGGIVMIN